MGVPFVKTHIVVFVFIGCAIQFGAALAADAVAQPSLKSFVDNPIIQLVALLSGIIGLPVAFLTYRLSRKDKLPRYAYESKTLIEGIDSAVPGLQVVFEGVPQKRITVTDVYFWNGGRDTIRKADLTGDDPLRIECALGGEVLSATLIYATATSCGVSKPAVIRPGEKLPTQIHFSFDFLDFNDGGVIQVVHTGPALQRLEVTGKIIGARKIQGTNIGISSSPKSETSPTATKLNYWFSVLSIFLIMATCLYLGTDFLLNDLSSLSGWFLILIGVLFFALFWKAAFGFLFPPSRLHRRIT